MRLKNISIRNNPTLGDLDIDFCNSDGKVCDTIILAGENGTGKSTILNILFELSEFRPITVPKDEIRTFQIVLNESEIELLSGLQSFTDGVLNGEITLKIDYSMAFNWKAFSIIFYDNYNNSREMDASVLQNHKYIMKSLYSDVEINFNPQEINSVTSKDVDKKQEVSIKSDTNLATNIAQLLIDIKNIDDSDLSDWVENNPGKIPPDEMKSIRMNRFKDAFHYMFPFKRFKGITNRSGKKAILFEEHGKEISLNELSSGEKQIVYRGGFLLEDIKSNQGVLVLIDEPEISLHPSWQLRIMNFFKRLFTNEDGNQTSQIIVVTHSPFIVHEQKGLNEKVIILTRNAAGQVEVSTEPQFYGWTTQTTIQKAFNIHFDLKQDKPVVFVEGETDEKYLLKAMEVFNISLKSLEIIWIGRTIENGKTEFTGESALSQTKMFLLANPKFLKQKTVLLYDSDTKQREQDFSNLYVRIMPFIRDSNIKKGIENLLVFPSDFPRNQFYRTYKSVNDYGGEATHEEIQKASLCEWICSLPDNESRTYLTHLKDVLENLNNLLSETETVIS
ncbi:AAA family ATPase [Paenibacillus sp. PAMC21692]|uniref:AAA family ATPase n=1 Tax=Paenibacillus sp. PAMC21692 TaxID=2762320 RepID=UPI00164EB832|nr:ATP-binding protein [Paenibacillus sp. PAMC21692]QNK54582.1 AAA family ATPase [Paenibacillus sp. PAMC21692]